MPESRRLWGRLMVLAAAVLAVHLWLLAGEPRLLRTPPPAAWTIRSIASDPGLATAVPEPVPMPVDAPPAPARTSTPTVRTAPVPSTSESKASAPSATPLRFEPPPPARFQYVVTTFAHGTTSQGTAELQWQHDGERYEAQLALSGDGLRSRTLRSKGLITAQGLAPLRFSDKARGEQAVHFERESGKLSFSSNRPEASLESGAQDRLSVMLQLAAMLNADPSRFPKGASIVLQTATTREALPWVFVVEGAEQLQLPGGEMAALKLAREPLGPYDSRLELWLAPSAAYAPARLRLTQPNGDWVDQQWFSTDSAN